MKKSFFVLLIFSIIITYINTVVFAEEKSDLSKIEAQSAILMDFETGRILWEKNSNAPMAMASTTKIMTAIITLENGNLSDTVVVSSKAAAAPKVKMNLHKDEEISLEALLYALMLQSSNDAAVAIAEHISGSVEDFCAAMTEKAKEIGAEDTIFETPNGLDAGDHHSTAHDLALIAQYALKNPEFVRITNTPNITVDSSRTTYSIYNKNRLLNEFEGANGVKTGFTGKAGHCFVGSAKRGDMQLISVVLASGWGDRGREQKWVDTKNILNYGFDNYYYHTIVKKEEDSGSFDVTRSKTFEIETYFSDDMKIPITNEEKSTIYIKTQLPLELKAPIEPDTVVGFAEVYVNDELYQEIDLLTKTGAERFDFKTCLETVVESFLELGTVNDVKVILPDIFE